MGGAVALWVRGGGSLRARGVRSGKPHRRDSTSPRPERWLHSSGSETPACGCSTLGRISRCGNNRAGSRGRPCPETDNARSPLHLYPKALSPPSVTKKVPGRVGTLLAPVEESRAHDVRQRARALRPPRPTDFWDPFWELGDALKPHFAAVAKRAHVTRVQLRILALIDERGPLTGAQISRLFEVSPAAISLHVEDAVTAGLIERRPSSRDRRRILVVPTPKGRATLRELERFRRELGQRFRRSVPAGDWATMVRVLTTISREARRLAPTRPIRGPARARRASRSR